MWTYPWKKFTQVKVKRLIRDEMNEIMLVIFLYRKVTYFFIYYLSKSV